MNSLPKVQENYPFKTLSPIIGEPNYSSINKISQELYANASSVPSTLGGGNHGHLGLVMNDYLYQIIAKTPSNSQKILDQPQYIHKKRLQQ